MTKWLADLNYLFDRIVSMKMHTTIALCLCLNISILLKKLNVLFPIKANRIFLIILFYLEWAINKNTHLNYGYLQIMIFRKKVNVVTIIVYNIAKI